MNWGIAKRLMRWTVKKQYSHAVCLCIGIALLHTTYIYKTVWALHCPHPFAWNWRFRYRDKAKNAFFIYPAISPAERDKDTFFFFNATLSENIISSKVFFFHKTNERYAILNLLNNIPKRNLFLFGSKGKTTFLQAKSYLLSRASST